MSFTNFFKRGEFNDIPNDINNIINAINDIEQLCHKSDDFLV